DRQHALGMVLANHVIVEHPADVARPRYPVARFDQRRLVLLADDVHAQLDALVADEHRRSGDQLADLVLALAAARAVQRVFGVTAAGLGHRHSVAGPARDALGRAGPVALQTPVTGRRRQTDAGVPRQAARDTGPSSICARVRSTTS